MKIDQFKKIQYNIWTSQLFISHNPSLFFNTLFQFIFHRVLESPYPRDILCKQKNPSSTHDRQQPQTILCTVRLVVLIQNGGMILQGTKQQGWKPDHSIITNHCFFTTDCLETDRYESGSNHFVAQCLRTIMYHHC